MTSLDLPTAAFIEEILHGGGWTINRGLSFDHVRVDQRSRNSLYYICLKSSGNPEVPNHLLLKTASKDSAEAVFYAASRGLDLPVPRCFGVHPSPDSEFKYILLEDLSPTHTNACDWPSPLPIEAAHRVVEALAQIHAAFWEPPRPDSTPVKLPEFLVDRTAYTTHTANLQRDFEYYTSRVGALESPSHLRLFESALAYLPHLWEEFWAPRLAQNRALPLIHGDLNPCNVLYPHAREGGVRLVDWEAHRRGLPGSDLAMLLGLHLCPEQEEALPLLRHYHASLIHCGIAGYTFDDLLLDYETALLYELFFPLKLFHQDGVQDQTMIENAILALESFSDAVI